MARFTVADCMEKIPNRFDMTLSAAIRARQIDKSGETLVDEDMDKPAVLSLREIADNKIDISILQHVE